jgi:hypothetical protein
MGKTEKGMVELTYRMKEKKSRLPPGAPPVRETRKGKKIPHQHSAAASERRMRTSRSRGQRDISLASRWKLGSAHIDRYNENKKESGTRQLVTDAKRVK